MKKYIFILVVFTLLFYNFVFAEDGSIKTSKSTYNKGDYIKINISLPEEEFSSCDIFLIDPTGNEFSTGIGGCVAGIRSHFDPRSMASPLLTYVPSGQLTMFISSSVNEGIEYGKLGTNFGVWTAKVIVHQNEQIWKILETKFNYQAGNFSSKICELKDENSKVCEVFNQKFTVKKGPGCGPGKATEITVSFPNGEEKTYLIEVGDFVLLPVNSIVLTNMSAPCSINFLKLKFDKPNEAVVQNNTKLQSKDNSINISDDSLKEVATQEEKKASQKLEDNIVTIENRNSFKTFLIGPDYKNLDLLKSELVTTENKLDKLNNELNKETQDSIKEKLKIQIDELNKTKTETKTYIDKMENRFSLLGWLIKMFQ